MLVNELIAHLNDADHHRRIQYPRNVAKVLGRYVLHKLVDVLLVLDGLMISL